MIDNNSAITAPFSNRNLGVFYGRSMVGKPLLRRDGKVWSGARFERVAGRTFGETG
jgi:hypothetical protein